MSAHGLIDLTPRVKTDGMLLMLLLDASLRISAITLLLLTAILSLRDGRHLLQARIAIALTVSLSGMLVSTMPAGLGLPESVRAVAWVLHIPNTVLLWLFGLSLFQDDFKLRRFHWSVLGAVIVTLLLMRLAITYDYSEGIFVAVLINRIIGFGTLVHLIWTALSGRQDDLIEARRRTRLWFTIGVAAASLLIITGETAHFAITGTGDDPDWLSTIRTAIAWPMVLFGTLWFTRLQTVNFLFESTHTNTAQLPSIDPKDAETHRKLTEIMESGVYTEQGLTIGNLAQRLSVPEHQLRALINKGLGFRNFSSFLNTYRIAYAKTILGDTKQSRLPILTIAMDAGYNSLAPFNRAFKSIEGVTPSNYRQRALVLS